MKCNFVYDSNEMSGEREYNIERERFDSPIVPFYVLFPREGVYLEADAHGNAAFYDLEDKELFRDKADGQGRYFSGFFCTVQDGTICVRFPIRELIDHYPHCDGEYDRYSYRTKDNVVIKYRLP